MNKISYELILIIIFCVLLFISNFFVINFLLKNNGKYVRIVWFLFSLSVILSFTISFVSRKMGYINETGEFKGAFGDFLGYLLKAALGVTESFYFVLIVSFLIIAPQLLNYILSGINGFAARPIFVEGVYSFFVWGVVKAMVVAAGVYSTISMYAFLDGWSGFEIGKAVGGVFVSTFLLIISFLFLGIYASPMKEVSGDESKKMRRVLRKKFGYIYKFHTWMIRNSKDDKDFENMKKYKFDILNFLSK